MLLDAFGGPKRFANILRDPYVEGAQDPAVWTAVREFWPVLKDCSDDSLDEALGPLKESFVDLRQL